MLILILFKYANNHLSYQHKRNIFHLTLTHFYHKICILNQFLTHI